MPKYTFSQIRSRIRNLNESNRCLELIFTTEQNLNRKQTLTDAEQYLADSARYQPLRPSGISLSIAPERALRISAHPRPLREASEAFVRTSRPNKKVSFVCVRLRLNLFSTKSRALPFYSEMR
jgi:hypothetical protein